MSGNAKIELSTPNSLHDLLKAGRRRELPGIQVVHHLIPARLKSTMNLTITVELKIKGGEAEVFVNGKKVATVETDSTKAEEEKVGATPGSKLTDFEYTGAKHSRKELEELLGVEFVREHEEHLKSRMK